MLPSLLFVRLTSHLANQQRTVRTSAILLILLAPFLTISMVACGGPSTQDIKGPVVKVLDNTFQPQELHIKAGDTVTWLNEGQTIHTFTADDESFDSGNLEPSKTWSRIFTQPGRYAYYCTLHGIPGQNNTMAGVIVVDGASGKTTGNNGFTQQALGRQGPPMPFATLRVPEDYPTVTSAVKAAKAGDLISIAPGMYHEAVLVSTVGITIRGRDRNTVIMDGDFKLANAFEVSADNVIIENMTARHYKSNGFYWTGVKGYRGSYLTAYDNGDYGIYAYNSTLGQFDHSLASGQPDSGFYIGGCQPCDAVIADVISEDNALGYSGTNAGGNLVIRDSIWRNNLAGIVPNTLDSEPKAPQDGATIIDNLVENNKNYNVPIGTDEYPAGGNGIVLAGGNHNLVANNVVNGHQYYGIIVIPHIDTNFWEPGHNTVKENVGTNSGVADLALAALSAGGTCFSDNTVSRTVPPLLQTQHACGSFFAAAGAGDPSATFNLLNRFLRVVQHRYSSGDWRTYPVPADIHQPGMPDPTIAPQGLFTPVERSTPHMTVASVTPGLTLAGLGLQNPFFEVLTSFYLYYLPLALYGAWLGIATWDVIRRGQMGNGDRAGMRERARIGWLAIIYLIPVLGPISYFLLGRSEISRATRYVIAIGVPVAYVVLAVALIFTVS